MLLLILMLCVPSCTTLEKSSCKGGTIQLEGGRNVTKEGNLIFISTEGQRKTLMYKGKATDPRITVSYSKVLLKGLQKEDEGKYQFTSLRGLVNQYEVKVIECITKKYMESVSLGVPERAQYLYFKGSTEKLEKLWDRTKSQNTDKRVIVKNNVWKMVNLTKADEGFYLFVREDKKVELTIKLSIKEETQDYKLKVNESLFIKFPERGGPWDVVFKSKNKQQRVMIKNQLVLEGTGFEGRITIQNNSIEIKSVTAEDSGTFNFYDQQGNLAMSVKLDVDSGSNHLAAYIVVPLVLLVVCVGGGSAAKKGKSKPSEEASVSPDPNTVHASPPDTNMYPLLHQVPPPETSTSMHYKM
ncbi:uncharacterized protein LOC119777927 [Cyprinodon tularosa]|uniref:uncharacterized protein LOC119777927 n=1 Tax=Cyprinodon tularosa TaxID=77115 RepID=UPI0018E1F72D|nr:uncharacterized protein LOC119777927 [Cyprinodon tularosa]